LVNISGFEISRVILPSSTLLVRPLRARASDTCREDSSSGSPTFYPLRTWTIRLVQSASKSDKNPPNVGCTELSFRRPPWRDVVVQSQQKTPTTNS